MSKLNIKLFVSFAVSILLSMIVLEVLGFNVYIASAKAQDYAFDQNTLVLSKRGIETISDEKGFSEIASYAVLPILRTLDAKEEGILVDDPDNLFSPGKSVSFKEKNGVLVYDGAIAISECDDCRYYPVGKRYALAASYKPEVIDTGLPGGQKLTQETVDAMKKLFEAANKKGLKPKVNSGYRSYETQLNTFNSWVQSEIAKGKSREQAEISANRYSARPGHSEHQLGTTADINCESCSPFDRSVNGNWGIWNFIAENAHKYGFVISYTEDKENLTGYVYEPWHIRYVGVDLATEIYKEDYQKNTNQITLENFLEDKKAF